MEGKDCASVSPNIIISLNNPSIPGTDLHDPSSSQETTAYNSVHHDLMGLPSIPADLNLIRCIYRRGILIRLHFHINGKD